MARRLGGIIGVLGTVGLLAGCSDDEPTVADSAATTGATTGATAATADVATTPAASSGGGFSVSISEPAAIEPALIYEVEGFHVTRLLFETLVTLDPDLEVQPGVATDWDVADDDVTWTFHLDPDAMFSDGTAVDAADFVYAFARSADPDLAAPAGYQGLPIAGWVDVQGGEPTGSVGDVEVTGVSAVDDHTLQIVTDEPFALLPKLLTYPVFAPVPSEMASDADAAASFTERPIGNGPYMMTEPWQHNTSITVVRNAEFHGTPGRAEQIDFRIYSDWLTSYRDFQAGSLDIARGIPPDEFQSAVDTYGERIIRTPTASLGYIGLPNALAPFDDLDFRMALSLAIDRQAIAERVLQGGSDAATGFVPTKVPGALQEPCPGCVFDPDLAKEHLAASGVAAGTHIVLYDISDDGQDVTEFVANSWTEILGLDVEVKSFEFAQYLEETAVDKVQGPFELGWVWDYPSGYSILSPLFQSDSQANNLSYSNPEFDDLMAQIRLSTDDAATEALLGEAQTMAEGDLPLIPLTFVSDLGAIAEGLEGVVVDSGAMWRLELVEPG